MYTITTRDGYSLTERTYLNSALAWAIGEMVTDDVISELRVRDSANKPVVTVCRFGSLESGDMFHDFHDRWMKTGNTEFNAASLNETAHFNDHNVVWQFDQES